MKICILGRHGLIGSALERKYISKGYEVVSTPTDDVDILYNFASPTHVPFEQNPEYHTHEILSSAQFLLPYCADRGILYIYPSSALVYEKDTQFAKLKKMTELYGSYYPNTLGLRIFPTYGPGENRTAIAQWCAAMLKGERPVIYGDGTQERDFIYVDDVVDQAWDLIDKKVRGVHDIGAGKPTSFNDIVAAINKALGTDIKPEYISQPNGYSKGIVCQDPGIIKVPIDEGVKRMLNV